MDQYTLKPNNISLPIIFRNITNCNEVKVDIPNPMFCAVESCQTRKNHTLNT